MELERVERAFEQHLVPVYHPGDPSLTLSKVIHNAKPVSGKLPFDDLSDAGKVCCL